VWNADTPHLVDSASSSSTADLVPETTQRWPVAHRGELLAWKGCTSFSGNMTSMSPPAGAASVALAPLPAPMHLTKRTLQTRHPQHIQMLTNHRLRTHSPVHPQLSQGILTNSAGCVNSLSKVLRCFCLVLAWVKRSSPK